MSAVRAIALSSLLLLVAACSPEGGVTIVPLFPSQQRQTDELLLPRAVETLRITITGEGMTDMIVEEDLDEEGTIRIDGIPAGEARLVVLEGLDAAENVAFFGSESVDITAGQTSSVAIELGAPFAGADGTGEPTISIVDADGVAQLRVRGAEVWVSISVSGAVGIVLANEQTMSAGRQALALSGLVADGDDWVVPDWDLGAGFDEISDGPRFVYAQFVNEASVTSRVYRAEVELDRTGPELTAAAFFQRCDNREIARLAQNAILAMSGDYGCRYTFDEDDCTGELDINDPGGPLRVTVPLREATDLATARIYLLDGVHERDLTIDTCASTPSFLVALYEPLGFEQPSTADNVYAELRDVAGNLSVIALGELRFDNDRPAVPDVDMADCIIYERLPWGAVNLGVGLAFTQRSWRVMISDACTDGGGQPLAVVEPLADVLVFDDREIAYAREIGGTVADLQGRFQPITLSVDDRAEIFLATVDPAGNWSDAIPEGSLQAARVRQVRWLANLGRKELGDTEQNPHLFSERGVLGESLVDPSETERIFALEVSGSAYPVTTAGKGRWILAQAPSDDLLESATMKVAVYDPARSLLVLTSAESMSIGQTTWEWDGANLVEHCYPGSGCSNHASPEFSQTIAGTYHPGLGEVFLAANTMLGPTGMVFSAWGWDGEDWHDRCDPDLGCGTSVLVFERFALAYDPRYDAPIAVVQDDNDVHTTAIWRDGQWEILCPGGCGLSTGFEATLDFDRAGDRLVLSKSSPNLANLELWAFEDGTWSPLCAAANTCENMPPWSFNLSTALDADGTVVVAVAGTTPNADDAAVWTYDGSWTTVCSGGCPGITEAETGALITYYDPKLERVVRLSSAAPTGPLLPRARFWTGTGWETLCPGSEDCPGAALGPMVYDPLASRLTMTYFGGDPVTYTFNSIGLMQWTGHSWVQTHASAAAADPMGRFSFGFGRDGTGLMVVGGTELRLLTDTCGSGSLPIDFIGPPSWGGCVLADIWRWEGGVWGEDVPDAGELNLDSPSIGYAAVDDTLWLAGGSDFVTPNTFEARYIWSGTIAGWEKQCGGPTVGVCDPAPGELVQGPEGELFLINGDSFWERIDGAWQERCPATVACGLADAYPSATYRFAWDDSLNRLLFFDGTTLKALEADGWRVLCDAETSCNSQLPGYGVEFMSSVWGEGLGFDSARGRAVAMVTDVSSGNMDIGTGEWEPRHGLRPSQVFRVDFSAAQSDFDPLACAVGPAACQIASVTVTWIAGGASRDEADQPQEGFELLAWRHGRWESLPGATSTAPIGGEASLVWSSNDPVTLASLFAGSDRAINLAAVPLGTNGTGAAQISTSAVEVEVFYRLAP